MLPKSTSIVQGEKYLERPFRESYYTCLNTHWEKMRVEAIFNDGRTKVRYKEMSNDKKIPDMLH